MAAIQRLCPNAFLLHDGGISKFGNTSEVIPFYMSAMEKYSTKGPVKSGPAELIIYMETLNGERKYIFNIGDPIRFIILLNVDRAINRAAFGLGIIDIMGGRVITHHTMFQHADSWGVKNSTRITVEWPECILCPGSYHFVLALFESGQMIALWEDIGELIVIEADYFGTGRLPDPHVQGKVVTIAKWHIEEQLHILN